MTPCIKSWRAVVQLCQLNLKQLRDRLTTTVSRLSVIHPDLSLRILIHASAIDKYLASGSKDSDSLAIFLSSMANDGMGFKVARGLRSR
jgi:hypothetical protein